YFFVDGCPHVSVTGAALPEWVQTGRVSMPHGFGSRHYGSFSAFWFRLLFLVKPLSVQRLLAWGCSCLCRHCADRGSETEVVLVSKRREYFSLGQRTEGIDYALGWCRANSIYRHCPVYP